MLAWLFPGQGSQCRGMGAELFERYPEHVATADACLGYSLTELCDRDPDGRLGETRFAQPALFVVSVLSALQARETGPPADYLAGHSLGEYAALCVAGSVDLATGVRLVRLRGELMNAAGPGGMLAVVGPAAADVDSLLADTGYADVDVANHNSGEQVVLSGPTESLRGVGRLLRARGVRSVPLPVTSAFHSRYMRPVAERFGDHLANIEFAAPDRPVMCNVTGLPHVPGLIRRRLVEQISRPVRWAPIVRHLLSSGVTAVSEMGPGTVLTGLWDAARRDGAGSAARRPAAGPVAGADAGPDPAGELGSAAFREAYGVRRAYVAGSMYRGIASTDLVIRMGRAGLMGFFGTGGLSLPEVGAALEALVAALGEGGRFGMNLLHSPSRPDHEQATVDLYLRRGVRSVEAAAFSAPTPALVRFRYAGARRDAAGRPVVVNRLLAKVSRPEVAAAFLRPPPAEVLGRLVADGRLTEQEAAVAAVVPPASDLCVESDSGGHTDGGVALALLPTILRLRDRLAAEHGRVRVGAAGGLGTPEALAAVFVLGAEFVVTGSVNQCSPEAGTSDAVKDMLAGLDVQDTAYAPAGDMFEAGATVQVVRKGTLFAARANRLHQVYRRYDGLDDIDAATADAVQRLLRRPFADIWEEARERLRRRPDELQRVTGDPKRRMAVVLKSYFGWSSEAAIRGDPHRRADYQIHSGPAIGAFNRWAEGTDLQDWRHRHVDVVADRLMGATADLLAERLATVTPRSLS